MSDFRGFIMFKKGQKHGNAISSYYKNIPDIKTCHDRIGDRIWKREITVTEVKGIKESRSQGSGMKKG